MVHLKSDPEVPKVPKCLDVHPIRGHYIDCVCNYVYNPILSEPHYDVTSMELEGIGRGESSPNGMMQPEIICTVTWVYMR